MKWSERRPDHQDSNLPNVRFSSAHAHSRKERERRPQVVRRSAPDSGVLIRLKAQMAEVHGKMANIKSQVVETGEPRPGPSGSFSLEEALSHRGSSDLTACHKPGELDLVGRAASARPGPCRPGKNSASKGLKNKPKLYCVRNKDSVWND